MNHLGARKSREEVRLRREEWKKLWESGRRLSDIAWLTGYDPTTIMHGLNKIGIDTAKISVRKPKKETRVAIQSSKNVQRLHSNHYLARYARKRNRKRNTGS